MCTPVPHCRLWVQNSLPFANRCLLLQLAEVCAAVAGRTLTARGQDTTAPATRRESWSLLVHCLLCFSAVAGRRPWLFPSALAGPFGYSAHLSVASMATPWLCSCFPIGMLSPQTVSRLAPVPSPMTITLAGSAVRGRAATAHHPLLFSLYMHPLEV